MSSAALPEADQIACGLTHDGSRIYHAPVEVHRGALQVMLDAFAVARAAANRAGMAQTLCDPRVEVLPHVADAWTAGLLDDLPSGPRDTSATDALLAAPPRPLVPRGPTRRAEGRWLVRHGMPWLARHLREVGAPLTAAIVGRSG